MRAGRGVYEPASYALIVSALVVPLVMTYQLSDASSLLTAIVPATVGLAVSAAVVWLCGRRLVDRWGIVFGVCWGAAGAASVGLYVTGLAFRAGDNPVVHGLLFAPPVEEGLKLLAPMVVAIIYRGERRASRRLVIILAGLASGAGFAFTENLATLALAHQNGMAAVLSLAVARVPVTVAHPVFTGLGATVLTWRRPRGAAGFGARAGIALLAASGTHMLWNLVGRAPHGFVLGLGFDALLLALAAIALTARVRPGPRPAPLDEDDVDGTVELVVVRHVPPRCGRTREE